MSLLLKRSLEGKNPGEGGGRQEPELAFYRERELEDGGKTSGVIGLDDQTSGRYRGSEGKMAASFASFFLVPSHHDILKSPDEDNKLLPAFCLGEDSW